MEFQSPVTSHLVDQACFGIQSHSVPEEMAIRIPQGGNSHLLYLPKKDGGLALPALSTGMYSSSTPVTSLCVPWQPMIPGMLRTSSAYKLLSAEYSLVYSTACSKRQLKSCVVHHILEDDSSTCRTHFTSLSVQGRVFRTDCDLTYWAEAVSSLPDREMRFACNAAIDTLPSNANLALW